MGVMDGWNAWTRPAPAVTDPASRWRASLLASMMLVGVPLAALVLLLLRALGGSTVGLPPWTVSLPLLAMTAGYVLSRTVAWRVGAWLAVASILTTVSVDLAIHQRVYVVLYAGVAVALAGMVLRKRATTGLVGFVLVWWWAAPWWAGVHFTAHENAIVTGFFVAMGILLALGLGVRERVERARLEQIELDEARYRGLLEVAFEGLLVVKDERIIDLNPGFEVLTGRPRLELVGRSIESVLVVEGGSPIDFPITASTSASHRAGMQQATGTRGDGREFHVEFVVRAQRTTRGLVHYVAVRDTTEREQATLQLSIAHRAVAMGTLSAGIAREIDNPLSWLMTNLKMAQQGVRAEALAHPRDRNLRELTDTLDDAVAGGRRVISIVRDLKTLSRDEDPGGTTDIHSALDLACRIEARPIEGRARLVRDYGHVPTVVGSPGRLGQVFVNLLANAVEAIERGQSQHNRIVLRTRRTEDQQHVEVVVRDTGRGIAAEDLPHVFDPFFTANGTPGENRGLGLSIARSIVDGLGGAISVESRPGEGSTFVVRLPVAVRPAAERSRPATAERTTRISGPHPQPAARAHKARVLIIDDEPLLGKSLGRALREHDVTFMEDPAAALELCAGQDFDAIICDLFMPVVGGEDVYRHLREHAPELAARMIFMTGGAYTEATQKFLRDIPNEVLNKPFAPRDLAVAVRRLLDANAKRDAAEPAEAPSAKEPKRPSGSLEIVRSRS